MLVTLSGISTDVIFVQLSKALAAIETNPAGRFREDRLQFSKAVAPIAVRWLLKVTLVRLPQALKVDCPNVVTLFGMMMLDNDEQPWNMKSESAVKPVPNVTDVNDVQF